MGVLFSIGVALVLAITITIVVGWMIEWGEEDSIAFDLTSDPNLVILVLRRVYEPKEVLKEICWVRCLTKLAQIYEDPNIHTAWMTAGWCGVVDDWNSPHAWIEYSVYDGNDGLITVRYDPTRDIYLEPLPEDANLLIPVVPIEPKEALEIIYGSEEKNGEKEEKPKKKLKYKILQQNHHFPARTIPAP